ncbi:rhomboid family intramembrane serine protease [Candidatus Micrarchaeota archaeon]|nr:rhomboid family intramembrane serine protease [Candidatus Micrarchaeota archaeon]
MYSLYLLGITFAIFFIQLLIPGFTEFFWLDPQHIFQQPWGFITSMFLHGGFSHLFFNMFALFIFGPILESRLGSQRFLMLYFAAGILGNIGYLLTGGVQPALGASGAIFGILGALVALEPNMIVFVSFIPMPMWVAGVFWFVLEVFSGVYVVSNIANFAHVFGLVLGYGFARYIKPQLLYYS